MIILVAPNSFKECADSVFISKIIQEKLETISAFKILSKPLSDGGDGFLSVCKLIFRTEPFIISVFDDLESKVKDYAIQIDRLRKNVFIESAELFGLKLLDKHQRNPLNHNSEVLGKIIAKLMEEANSQKLDVQTVWIGVGGTATIDFGMGACAQLGVEFYNGTDSLIQPVPKYFSQVTRIKFNETKLPFKIKCVVDVNTPLLAEPGSIEIYGNQKGASEDDLKIIKDGIKNLFNLFTTDKKLSLPKKLNGAGGGLAAGLNFFFGAEIISAEKFIKSCLLKDINLEEVDAVITGEGSFDYQSFKGKGTGIILNFFKGKSTPIFIINGSTYLPDDIKLPENVKIINTINYFRSREESIKYFQMGIEKATEIVANQISY